MLKHIFPNILSPVLVTISMSMPGLATSEVLLSWLGIGIRPPNPSWGLMLFEYAGQLRDRPHLLLAPAIVVGVFLLAWNLFGDGLNDALNPRAR
jgi:peptide/nickel transport system permease protein